MARRKTKSAAPPVAEQSSVAQAIFDPDGDIHVRAVAPSGNVYEIKPRAAFPIAGEDVDWFFYEWDWQWRQRLYHAENYQPRRPQFDNGAANLAARIEEPERPAFDNGAANLKARVDEPERPQFDNGGVRASYQEPKASPPEEPVTEPEESAPDPVEAGDGDNEDKE